MQFNRKHLPDAIEAMRADWNAGLTAAEIALKHRITRNAVIGVAHRNGFAERPSPIIRNRRRRRAA